MSLHRAGATALAVLALAGCGTGGGAVEPTSGGGGEPLTVVTSTNVYGSIARAVGGDRITVESLINDPAADPHSYESTPADAAKVAGATVVVLNGGGYDEFVNRLVESAGSEVTTIDVLELSGLAPEGEAHAEGDAHQEGEAHAAGEAAHAEGEEHGHGDVNEHVWYSLPTVQALATRLAADLGAADPAGAAAYTAGAEAFNERVAELTTRVGAIGAAHPGARVAVTEPVPGYLVEAAGLTDATPGAFTEAIEEDTDPPAAVLQETLTLFSGDPVAALIVNAQTETPTTDQVEQAAQTGGVPVVDVTETLPEGTTDYVSWMGAQIDALAGALNGNR